MKLGFKYSSSMQKIQNTSLGVGVRVFKKSQHTAQEAKTFWK